MKFILPTLSLISLGLLASCQQTATPTNNNPYGVPGLQPQTNPYAAPLANGETGAYNPNVAPPQPIPGVNQNAYQPAPIPQAAQNYGQQDYSQQIPSGPTSSHTVVAGDSLWGLAKRYNTTVEQIQVANSLTSTLIRTGQTLQIPSAQ